MTEPAALPEISRDTEWQRLDPRMLLVHPIREVIRFLPALIAIAFAGRAVRRRGLAGAGHRDPGRASGCCATSRPASGSPRGRIELKRGLLSRHVLSTPVDRVRTVDLTSSLIHRVLGLTTVRIGTGTASTSDDEQLDLDGLPVDRARALREELLRVSPARRRRVGTGRGGAARRRGAWSSPSSRAGCGSRR